MAEWLGSWRSHVPLYPLSWSCFLVDHSSSPLPPASLDCSHFVFICIILFHHWVSLALQSPFGEVVNNNMYSSVINLTEDALFTDVLDSNH